MKNNIKLMMVVSALLGMVACAQEPAGNVQELVAGPLVRADGADVAPDALQDKTVAFYFSAQWCPPCRNFTPLLVAAYDEWKAADKPIELVFVSFDRDEGAMQGYMRDYNMNWPAVPFADETRRQGLAENWNIRGIPALVVVGPDGKTISKSGVEQVRASQAAAVDPWLKP